MKSGKQLLFGAAALGMGTMPGVANAYATDDLGGFDDGEAVSPAAAQAPAADQMVHPVTGLVGSQPGDCRPLGDPSCPRAHAGYDISQNNGNPVGASCKGTARVHPGYNNGAGNYVEVTHTGGYTTRYLHLNDFTIADGQWVNQGDVVGHVGNTGASSGAHLHFEVRRNGQPMVLASDYNRWERTTKGETMAKDFDASLVCS